MTPANTLSRLAEIFTPLLFALIVGVQVVLIGFAVLAGVAAAFWLLVLLVHAGRMIRDGKLGAWRK